MKLYIWNDPYPVEYGGCFLFVIAPTLDAARKQAKKTIITRVGTPYQKRGINIELGEPDRIIDQFPYAECYEWSE